MGRIVGPISRLSPSRDLEHSGGVIVFVRLNRWRKAMNGLIYLVGLIVVILAILSFFGLR
jgi:hypothetical protein